MGGAMAGIICYMDDFMGDGEGVNPVTAGRWLRIFFASLADDSQA